MEFNAHGFKCKLDYGKFPNKQKGKILTASFLGVDCEKFQRLAELKSWFEAYKYNKIGSLKSKQKGPFHFSIAQKEGEHFLKVEANGKRAILDYVQATMIEMALGKCLNFIDANTWCKSSNEQ